MNFLRVFEFTSIVYLLLSSYCFAPAMSSSVNFQDRGENNKSLLRTKASLPAQSLSSLVSLSGMRRLSGSRERGKTVTNTQPSLDCTLEKWQLIGVFREGQIIQTKGELVFSITNKSSKKQRFVLGELLFLNDRDRALTVSNPHRKLQGQFIDFKPPLEPDETRTHTENIWYRSGWEKVELKTCRWLKQGQEYWEIYPELKKPETQSESSKLS